MGRKLALLIANSVYDDEKYPMLNAPKADVKALARVLEDPDIGGFQVLPFLLDEPKAVIEKEIERFFSAKKRDDMLLLYFSSHGDITSKSGSFYMVVKDTYKQELISTGISSDFLKAIMNESFSKQQIVILDCCYSGAFFLGAKGETNISALLRGSGRVIFTAASSTQIAWEDREGVQAKGLSFFTSSLVRGLETGDADGNKDGVIDADELYQYIFAQLQQVRPDQTPAKWIEKQQGIVIIAKRKKQLYLSSQLEQSLTSSSMLVEKGPTKVSPPSQGKVQVPQERGSGPQNLFALSVGTEATGVGQELLRQMEAQKTSKTQKVLVITSGTEAAGVGIISADVITSRFRAEMAAFLRTKEMTIFFASMAHLFSQHASQAVSRGSEAALIPLEKRATLTQPLSQNAPKPARIFTGTDSIDYLHQVQARPSSRLRTMVCSIDTDNLSAYYADVSESEWLRIGIPSRHIDMLRSDPTLQEILYPGLTPKLSGSGSGSIRYNAAGAIIINHERVKIWLKEHMTNLIASDDCQNNLAIVVVVSAVGATGSGTLERLLDMIVSIAQDVRIPEPIPLDVFILQPGYTNISALHLANTAAFYLEGSASHLLRPVDADEDNLHRQLYRGRTIMVGWRGNVVLLEKLSQLRKTAATLIRVTHDPASGIAKEFLRTENDHYALRALDVQTNLPSYLSSATPVTISLGNLEEQIIRRDAVRLVNQMILGEQFMGKEADALFSEQSLSNVSRGPLLDSLVHFLQGNNSDERYKHLLERLSQDVPLTSLQTTAELLNGKATRRQVQKLRADWLSDKGKIPMLVEGIRQKGNDFVLQVFQLIDATHRRGIGTTLSLFELYAQYRAMRQVIVEMLNGQLYNVIRVSEQQVNDELGRLAHMRLKAHPQAAISAVQANLREIASHTTAQSVLHELQAYCDEVLRDLELSLSRQLQSDVNWQMAQQPLIIATHHPLELPALTEKEVNGFAEEVSIFSTTRNQTSRSNFKNLLQSDDEKINPQVAFRKWLEDEGKLDLLLSGNIKKLYDLAFTYAKKYVHDEILEHSILTILQHAGDGVLEQRIRYAISRSESLVRIDRSLAPELEEELLICALWENTVQEANLRRAVEESSRRPYKYKLLLSEDPSEIIIFYYADGLPVTAIDELAGRSLDQFLAYRSRWYGQQLQAQHMSVPVYSGLDAEKRVAKTGVLYELYRMRHSSVRSYTVQDIPELGAHSNDGSFVIEDDSNEIATNVDQF